MDCLLLCTSRAITIEGIHPQVQIKHCCNTVSNEWTTRGSCHLPCHLQHWRCYISFTQQITQVPALWGKQHIGTTTPRLLVPLFIKASNSKHQLRAQTRMFPHIQALHAMNTNSVHLPVRLKGTNSTNPDTCTSRATKTLKASHYYRIIHCITLESWVISYIMKFKKQSSSTMLNGLIRQVLLPLPLSKEIQSTFQ